MVSKYIPINFIGLQMDKLQFKSIFISDAHLGSKGAQADKLLDFLNRSTAEVIYLVGDIIDGWQLNKKWHWPESHKKVLQKLIKLSEEGKKVVYISGNHDDFLRKIGNFSIGSIKICSEITHKAVNKKKYLVIHGDQFDNIVKNAKWLAIVGDAAYNIILKINRHFNQIRNLLGLEYFAISAWIKRRVKLAVNFVSDFEKRISQAALKRKMDGVICGHIHHAELRKIGTVEYINCGDWVESCTALVENINGEMQLINWSCSKQIKNLMDTINKKSGLITGTFAA